MKYLFGSDNFSGVHPLAFKALEEVNKDHVVAYGEDAHTAHAIKTLQAPELLGPDASIWFTLNGTGTNVVVLSALARSWQSVVCPATAHINTDEAGAPEHMGALKLIPVPTPDGKLTPAYIEPTLSVLGFDHAAQPHVISISNTTEQGGLYTPAEIRELCDFAHARGLKVHCDGARIANAVAACGCSLADLTYKAGLDALSLGGTKNGLMFAEAAVFFGEVEHPALFGLRKSNAQMASKMRYIAAQFDAMFSQGLWLECAQNANAMGERLRAGFKQLGWEMPHQTQANETFVCLPQGAFSFFEERYGIYAWDGAPGEVRFVTSWDTTPEQVDAVLDDAKRWA